MPSSPFERPRRGRTCASIAFLFVAAASACGGGDDALPSADGGSGGQTGGDDGPRCPDAEPTAGDVCANVLKSCMYGDSVRAECRRVWSCDGGAWKAPATSCSPTVDCPSAEPVESPPCARAGDLCTYGDDLCRCASCVATGCTDTQPRWSCEAPPSGGCPARVPNFGAACSDRHASCIYFGGSCAGPAGAAPPDGETALCVDGTWTWETCF